jgi:hypothetical protein
MEVLPIQTLRDMFADSWNQLKLRIDVPFKSEKCPEAV